MEREWPMMKIERELFSVPEGALVLQPCPDGGCVLGLVFVPDALVGHGDARGM